MLAKPTAPAFVMPEQGGWNIFHLRTACRNAVTGIRPAPLPFPWGVRNA